MRAGRRGGPAVLGLAAGLVAGVAVVACRPAPLELPAVARGQREVARLDDGSLRPRFLGADNAPGLCLDVPPSTDASRWEMALHLGGRPAGDWAPPQRQGSAVCFDGRIPDGLPSGDELELCADLIDRFDGRRFRVPCRTVSYDAEPVAYRRLKDALDALLASRASHSIADFARSLDELGAEARREELPLMAVRLDLVATYFLTLEGSPETLAQAQARLDALPAWLDRPEVSRRGAQAAFHLAQLEARRFRLAAAWEALAETERRGRRIADPDGITVTILQAQLLTLAGAPQEAVQRLEAALADCRELSCEPAHEAYGRLQLAWLLMLDPDASAAELAAAEEHLAAGMASLSPEREPVELANQLVNGAYLDVRRGRDPAAALGRARDLAAGLGEASARLTREAALVEGLWALGRDDARARELCEGLIAEGETRLQAWAWSCAARARRRLGDLRGAETAFAEALERHALLVGDEAGGHVPLGRGQRGADFARAALVEIELGEPARAWTLLAGLDTLTVHEDTRRRCREQAVAPADVARWRTIDDELPRLLGELAELDRPASRARERELAEVRRALRERLRALWREWPGCPAAREVGDAGVGYRAFEVDGEVVLLRRAPSGEVTVDRRTRLPRPLSELVADLRGAMDRRVDDGTWRRLGASLAASLVPTAVAGTDTGGTGALVFALHGLLQGVPVAALPVPGAEPSADGIAGPWLGEVAAVAVRPSGAGNGDVSVVAERGLFVVDPLGNLPGASALLDDYRRLFPRARVLQGAEATRAAFRDAVAGVDWLHLDVHGAFEPAFPELSGLRLADGRLSLMQLTDFPAPRRFVNLSGCQTGRWPLTADSGHYGLGGLLARLGAAWVVASRADLPDRLAHDYNRVFYERIRDGATVPAAHRAALSAAGRTHPASSWSGILLLRGG